MGTPEAYALSAQALNRLAEENRKSTPFEDLFKISREDYDHVYTAADEAYVVRMRVGAGGVPVTMSSYEDSKSGRYHAGSSIEAWVTRNGVVRLSVFEGITDPEFDRVDARIIPVDEALRLAADKYKDVISDTMLDIREIRLEYVARPHDESYEHTYYALAWYLSPGFDAEKYLRSIRVDALTGEVF
ncbi:MAG: hypothetical protein LBG81_08975 [Coriobacteriaceae bacterium]|nr:hypothetical protein [Coriobacteriaceae bacterium]